MFNDWYSAHKLRHFKNRLPKSGTNGGWLINIIVLAGFMPPGFAFVTTNEEVAPEASQLPKSL
jgi:hypothetical protein